MEDIEQLERTPAEIARAALPAVVEVVTYRESGKKLAGGSGFVATPEGHVITSHHVLEGAARAEVHFGSGEVFDVEHVSAADPRRDLAVLRVAGFDLSAVDLGDSREVGAGEAVVVIGSPLGLTNTVTHGLVSAHRQMDGKRVLQISAPVSSGSSGGPVFDMRGRVIGVLAGFMRKGQNVNFAVPVEYARGLLELPSHSFTVRAVGRRRTALIGGTVSEARGLSLQALLRGESVPGEEGTPWALQPRRVDADSVRRNPAASADQLGGLWELRELSRVPGTRSGLYRGVLVSDGSRLSGTFFASLVRDPEFDHAFEGDRIRSFDASLEPGGRISIHGGNGCSYYMRAAPHAMSGVYECTDDDGEVYDVGAVEARRIRGTGPSGVYAYREQATLGSGLRRTDGEILIFALPDGRWVGKMRAEHDGWPRVYDLEDGRWTADGHLRARFSRSGGQALQGTFESDALELRYPIGTEEYSVEATLQGERLEPEVSPATDDNADMAHGGTGGGGTRSP